MQIITSTVKHSVPRQTIYIGLLILLAHVHVVHQSHRQADNRFYKLLFQVYHLKLADADKRPPLHALGGSIQGDEGPCQEKG